MFQVCWSVDGAVDMDGRMDGSQNGHTAEEVNRFLRCIYMVCVLPNRTNESGIGRQVGRP